jgi:hypothetical protein
MNELNDINSVFRDVFSDTQISGLIESDDLKYLELGDDHPRGIYDLLDNFL